MEDKEVIDTELQLKDLETVESQRQKQSKIAAIGNNKDAKVAVSVLEAYKEVLEKGQNARCVEFESKEEQHYAHDLFLLTAKPVLYVCNVDEASAKSGNKYSEQIAEIAKNEGAEMLVIAAKTEEDIASLETYEDKQMFLEELGLEESGVNRLIKKAYNLLNLQTFIPRVCAGETMSMDLTEPDAGSDLQRVMLKATQDEDGTWRLNGVKRFITNGDSDIHLVLARSEEGTRDGRGLSMFIYDKRDGGVTVRHIEHKLGIHGSPTCELVYKNAKAELCGSTRLGLIKYVMALMNGARLGIAAQSVGVSQAAYDEALKYARERKQFDTAIVKFPAVYDMIARIKAKLDAGRSILYQTARYVDIYKALEDISRERKLTPEERAELKKYSRLADAFTPLAKGMNSEYANQNTYDAIQVHGGSGFIMEYKCQRLYRDARIFSIYEGTTQLQVVAAIRYITNGTYLGIIKEMLEKEVSEDLQPLKVRVVEMVKLYEQALDYVKQAQDQEVQDFLARRLYNMTGDIVMSLLILEDATRSVELFSKSANVYVRMAQAEVMAEHVYIMNFVKEDLPSFRAE